MPPNITKETDLKSLASRLTEAGLDEVNEVLQGDQEWVNASTIELSMYGQALKANPHLSPNKEICAQVHQVASLGTETIEGMARMAEVLRRGDKTIPAQDLQKNLDTIAVEATQMKTSLEGALQIPQQACKGIKLDM